MKNLCKQNWYQITLLFLFCVTVFLRFYKLTVLPDVLHIDEAALGYNSWCLANYGTDRYLMCCLSIRRIFTVVKALSILTLSYC